jgi:serine/threonine protein kinase
MAPINDGHQPTASEIYRVALDGLTDSLEPQWQAMDWSTASLSWRLFRLRETRLPHQGWKIHVSSSAHEAAYFCSLVLPVLFKLGATFKICRRLEDFVLINSGDGGALQLGKVVTVYPRNAAHASEVATQVDKVWPTGRGPEVQTDLHVRPGSAVSLRFGAFGSEPTVISSSGIVEVGLFTPSGTLVPDTRRMGGEQYEWAPPPPILCYPPRPHPLKLRQEVVVDNRRYVPLALLRNSPKTKIFLGLSVDTVRTVIFKSAHPGVAGDDRGIDGGDRLKKEFEILSTLAAHPDLAPRPCGWIDGEWPILIMEDFRGERLSDLTVAERTECLLPLAKCLAELHGAGFVHGDIKLENAVRRGQRVGLIDFELAEAEGSIAGAGGTRGHLAPEVVTQAKAEFARDVFALGGCITHAVLGVPPGLFPRGTGRQRGLLRLEGSAAASHLVGQFANPDPTARPTAAEAAEAISNDFDALRRIEPAFGRPSSTREAAWCRRASVEAASLVRRFSRRDLHGMCWSNEHFQSSFCCEGLNVGAAGIILGLITIDQALGRSDFVAEAGSGATWLSTRPAAGNSAGLFTGNAGVAVALAVAGKRFHHDPFILASKARLRNAATNQSEVDIFSGSAGVVFASCILSDVLGESWPLDLGYCAMESLKKFRRLREDIPVWSVDARATQYLGCAHGSAGVAMALGCWGQRTGDQEAVNLALETFHQLFLRGRSKDCSGLRMTADSEDCHAVGTWCHGVAGYLWSILQSFGDHPKLQTEIDWAVAVLRNSMTAGTSTYCHGLAGRLELWRMLRGFPRFQDLAAAQAGKTAQALRLLHHKREEKACWRSDDPLITTPDLWIGFLGPATALALHAENSNLPLCSGAWLAACANATSDGAIGKREIRSEPQSIKTDFDSAVQSVPAG